MVFHAGVGKREITPPVGTPLGGRPTSLSSRSVHDSLWVKAVYFKSGDTRAVLLCVDLFLVPDRLVSEIREKIAEELNVPNTAVVVCATHTHSATGSGWKGEEAYGAEFVENAAAAAAEAKRRASPASVFYASAQRSDLSHNRRFVLRDGSVVTHPRKNDDPLHTDGPVDPEIQSVLITDRVFPTKDIFNVPLDFRTRRFDEIDDAGKRLIEAALGM